MNNHGHYRFKIAAFIVSGITASLSVCSFTCTSAFGQTTFHDVKSNYWAAGFIKELTQRQIITGFPDGSFRPEEAVTRAQFAAMISKAFKKAPQRQTVKFVDVPSKHWALNAIDNAYTTNFLARYPNNRFKPNQNIPRQRLLVSLISGLQSTPSNSSNGILKYYNVPSGMTGYTKKQIIVDHPNVKFIDLNPTATRAQAAALIYQALISSNQVSTIKGLLN